MTPKRSKSHQNRRDCEPYPMSELNTTVPGGWDVSAFYAPEKSYPYRSEVYPEHNTKAVGNHNDCSEDPAR